MKPMGLVLFDHEIRLLLSVGGISIIRPFSADCVTIDGGTPDAYIWNQLRWDEAWVDGFPDPTISPQPYLQVPRIDLDEQDRYVHRIRPRFTQNSQLWVKESWKSKDSRFPKDVIYYRSDRSALSFQAIEWFLAGERVGRPKLWPDGPGELVTRWRSAVSMPQWASRIQLRIKSSSIFRIRPFSNPNFEYRASDIFPTKKTPDTILFRPNYQKIDQMFWDRKFPKCRMDSKNWVFALECERIFKHPNDDDCNVFP